MPIPIRRHAKLLNETQVIEVSWISVLREDAPAASYMGKKPKFSALRGSI
jgi:hypothetical protein